MDSLFDDALFTELKKLSAEDLLIKCIGIIDGLDLKPLPQYGNDISQMKRDISLIKEKIKEQLQNLQVYLGEIYRRNIINRYDLFKTINDFLEYKCVFCNDKNLEYLIAKSGQDTDLICSPCYSKYLKEYATFSNESGQRSKRVTINYKMYQYNTSKILCDDDLTSKQRQLYDNLSHISGYISIFKDKLQEIQMVKQTMLRIMKTPLLTKELEACMDEILDLNGNKISQMKEYLTEDQYRFVRSGAKFEELEGQQEMLDNLNKILKKLKICAVGQSLLEPPIAYAILVPPAIQHLEKELKNHKKRQNKHEKDLEKLKCKI
jgi:uncharacterized protein YqgQ